LALLVDQAAIAAAETSLSLQWENAPRKNSSINTRPEMERISFQNLGLTT
jgi:hypothetical protein